MASVSYAPPPSGASLKETALQEEIALRAQTVSDIAVPQEILIKPRLPDVPMRPFIS